MTVNNAEKNPPRPSHFFLLGPVRNALLKITDILPRHHLAFLSRSLRHRPLSGILPQKPQYRQSLPWPQILYTKYRYENVRDCSLAGKQAAGIGVIAAGYMSILNSEPCKSCERSTSHSGIHHHLLKRRSRKPHLSPLIRWHAEGCARRPVRVRGGVLDDQVGYGKTAISLGLIDCAYKEEG